MKLTELKPLKDTPVVGLDSVDISTLPEGPAFLLLAIFTGRKPKPADVLAVCRRNPLDLEQDWQFYLLNVVPGYQFLYRDKTVDGKRVRRLVCRLETAAQELADAVDAVATGPTVDLRALEAIIKPRPYKARPHRPIEETREALLASIASLSESQGYCPSLRQVAENTGLSLTTVHHHVQGMKEDGLVAFNGQHTLRVIRG